MASCGPSCTIPSCASSPVVGFGSRGSGGLALGGLGLGGLGYGGLGYGYGIGGVGETSSSLGTLEGVIPSCINQIPAAEVVIQPPACVVTIPGPILSASCEPTAVGGNTPCAVGGSGIAYRRGLWSPSLFGGPIRDLQSPIRDLQSSIRYLGSQLIPSQRLGWKRRMGLCRMVRSWPCLSLKEQKEGAEHRQKMAWTSPAYLVLRGVRRQQKAREDSPPRSDMANCGPSCTIPSCASTPIVGLGSTGCRGIGWSSGGLGWGYGGHGHGYAETSGNLGTLPGVIPSCVNQTPPSRGRHPASPLRGDPPRSHPLLQLPACYRRRQHPLRHWGLWDHRIRLIRRLRIWQRDLRRLYRMRPAWASQRQCLLAPVLSSDGLTA
ncbi:hypothetical protein lerEdw1_015470 [Lerista edwardsae]|nr:hypothetical protein lerEdw1_015470 [Lerista edwardsae]